MSTGVGLRIKSKRLELGISQEELAARMGLKSKSTICKIERGEDNLTTDSVKKYAKALNCTPLFLMGWEDADGNPIETPHKKIPFDPSAYRKDFLKRAVEYYQRIQKLSPEHQAELESYLEFLQTRTDNSPIK